MTTSSRKRHPPLTEAPRPPALDGPALERVADYCRGHWDASAREGVTHAAIEPVPFRHTTPCISGNFIALFYWDTYFTNLGLLRQDRVDLARSNCDALLYLLGKKGFVPNSTFKDNDTRSQPPYLSLMVREVYEHIRDPSWLASTIPLLEAEYHFWTGCRGTPTGLSRHFHQAPDDYLLRFYDKTLTGRLKVPSDASRQEKLQTSAHRLAEAETGCDFTTRFQGRCADYNPVELNANLYQYEKNFAFFARELVREGAAAWEEKAETRAALMNRLMWDEASGLFRDYDFVQKRMNPVTALSTFSTLWAGLATPVQAARMRGQLDRFERTFGPAATEEGPTPSGQQWDFPNGWPPLFWITVAGLKHYGFTDDARRIASAFCALTLRHFERTGKLWEKFDVTTGAIAGGEYEAQPMMGWSAGVFLACLEHLKATAGSTLPCNSLPT